MNPLPTLLGNSLLSLHDQLPFAWWGNLVEEYWAYLSLLLAGLFLAGLATSLGIGRDPHTSRRLGRVPGLLFFPGLVACVAGAAALCFGPLNAGWMTGLEAALACLLLGGGARTGRALRRHPWFRLYSMMALAIAATHFLVAYLSGGVQLPTVTKSLLKQTFHDATGRDANQDEKKSFWKTTVGNETPSDRKKNDFWRGNEKK